MGRCGTRLAAKVRPLRTLSALCGATSRHLEHLLEHHERLPRRGDLLLPRALGLARLGQPHDGTPTAAGALGVRVPSAERAAERRVRAITAPVPDVVDQAMTVEAMAAGLEHCRAGERRLAAAHGAPIRGEAARHPFAWARTCQPVVRRVGRLKRMAVFSPRVWQREALKADSADLDALASRGWHGKTMESAAVHSEGGLVHGRPGWTGITALRRRTVFHGLQIRPTPGLQAGGDIYISDGPACTGRHAQTCDSRQAGRV